MNPVIVLASNSPRRKELLRQIGVEFIADPADVDEQVLPGESPEAHVIRLARAKASVAAQRAARGIIIAADTVVVADDHILGKPFDAADAVRMLEMLSGRMHRVITGIAMMDASTGSIESDLVMTRVWFRSLTRDEIAAYVATGEPMDKAGAYGIQERGALLVERIEGCYFNVVGLPLSRLAAMLRSFNFRVF